MKLARRDRLRNAASLAVRKETPAQICRSCEAQWRDDEAGVGPAAFKGGKRKLGQGREFGEYRRDNSDGDPAQQEGEPPAPARCNDSRPAPGARPAHDAEGPERSCPFKHSRCDNKWMEAARKQARRFFFDYRRDNHRESRQSRMANWKCDPCRRIEARHSVRVA